MELIGSLNNGCSEPENATVRESHVDVPMALSQGSVPTNFQSVGEFQSRPDYVPELSCALDDLDKIIGKYSLSKSNRLRCGLNRCHQWHQYGYVFRTNDGRETHCGKDCGKRAFGVNFNEVVAAYKREEDVRLRQKMLTELLANKSQLLSQASLLRNEVLTASKNINTVLHEFNREPPLLRALQSSIRNDGRIQVAMKTDRELRTVMGNVSDKAELETIGRIVGGVSITLSQSMEREIRLKVIASLEGLTANGLAQLNSRALENQTKKIATMREILVTSQRFLIEAKRFCSTDNKRQFVLLKQIIPRSSHTSRLDRILSRIENLS